MRYFKAMITCLLRTFTWESLTENIRLEYVVPIRSTPTNTLESSLYVTIIGHVIYNMILGCVRLVDKLEDRYSK